MSFGFDFPDPDDDVVPRGGVGGMDEVEVVDADEREEEKRPTTVIKVSVVAGRSFPSTCSPFVEVEISGALGRTIRLERTQVVPRSGDPIWGEKFDIAVDRLDGKTLTLRVIDRNVMAEEERKDQLLGQWSTSLVELLWTEMGGWQSLVNARGAPVEGEIKMSLTYEEPEQGLPRWETLRKAFKHEADPASFASVVDSAELMTPSDSVKGMWYDALERQIAKDSACESICRLSIFGLIVAAFFIVPGVLLLGTDLIPLPNNTLPFTVINMTSTTIDHEDPTTRVPTLLPTSSSPTTATPTSSAPSLSPSVSPSSSPSASPSSAPTGAPSSTPSTAPATTTAAVATTAATTTLATSTTVSATTVTLRPTSTPAPSLSPTLSFLDILRGLLGGPHTPNATNATVIANSTNATNSTV